MEFRGREYGDLGIDEATDQTEQELAILFSCCRSTVSGFVPKRVLTFNPGGVGHAYVKRLFIDRLTTPEEAALNPAFIQAYAWDNIMWVRDALARDRIAHQEYRAWPDDKRAEYLIRNSDYGKTLNALPADLRDAWLWGRWDIFAGQFFDCFRPDKHVEEMVEERAA
jgi:phage terminase large subunit